MHEQCRNVVWLQHILVWLYSGILEKAGVDTAGIHTGQFDLVTAQLFRQSLAETLKTKLRRGIGGAFRIGGFSENGTNVNNMAGVRFFFHQGDDFCGHVERPAQIGVDHLVPPFQREGVDVAEIASASIVDQNVGSYLAGKCLFNPGGNGVLIGDVQRNGQEHIPQLILKSFESRRIAGEAIHFGTFVSQSTCQCGSQTTTGTGDDGIFLANDHGLLRLGNVSMRNSDTVDMGEIFADLSWVRHERVAVGMLHLEVRGKILRHGCEHQNRATLIGLAQQ